MTFQGSISFVDHFCYLRFMSVRLSCLFLTALWSPVRKGLTSCLCCVWCYFVFVTFYIMSWVRCGIWLHWFLIVTFFFYFKHTLSWNTIYSYKILDSESKQEHIIYQNLNGHSLISFCCVECDFIHKIPYFLQINVNKTFKTMTPLPFFKIFIINMSKC